LAHVGRAVVEEVVADLEGEPEVGPDGTYRLLRFLAGAHAHGAADEAGLDERGGLVRDDAKVRRLVDVLAPGLLDLEQLALAHAADGVGDDVEQRVLTVIEREEKAPAQQEVAEEDGHLVLPQRV